MSRACLSRRGFVLASVVASVVAGLAGFGTAEAQPLTGRNLLQALRSGGYVIVMRHASSPPAPPGTRGDRRLDAKGRRDATAMGVAIRVLGIPIGEIWTSPTYRARETVRLLALPATPRSAPELGDIAPVMRGANHEANLRWSRWLRDQAEKLPRGETNVLIVTQSPNISAAFGEAGGQLAEGEALIFHPRAGKTPVARLRIEDWTKLGEG